MCESVFQTLLLFADGLGDEDLATVNIRFIEGSHGRLRFCGSRHGNEGVTFSFRFVGICNGSVLAEEVNKRLDIGSVRDVADEQLGRLHERVLKNEATWLCAVIVNVC